MLLSAALLLSARRITSVWLISQTDASRVVESPIYIMFEATLHSIVDILGLSMDICRLLRVNMDLLLTASVVRLYRTCAIGVPSNHTQSLL